MPRLLMIIDLPIIFIVFQLMLDGYFRRQPIISGCCRHYAYAIDIYTAGCMAILILMPH